jgi:hypothetical protein
LESAIALVAKLSAEGVNAELRSGNDQTKTFGGHVLPGVFVWQRVRTGKSADQVSAFAAFFFSVVIGA